MSEDVKKKETTVKKNKSKSNPIYKNVIIVVLVVIIAVIFIIGNKNKFDNFIEGINSEFASMGVGDGFPYNINTNSVVQMERMQNEIAVLTDNSFLILNSSADEVVKYQHAFLSPGMDVSKNRSIVYDQGGKRFKIYNKSKMLCEKNTTENIINCAMSESGIYGIATQSNTSSCELKIYSRNFEELLTWYSSANHIIDISISPDGDKAVVATAGADSGELKSTIYILDFKHEEPIATFEYYSTMFVDLTFSKNADIIAVGDNLISIIGANNEKIEDILYTDYALKNLDSQNTYNTTALYSVYNSSNSASVVMIDDNANLTSKIQINENIRFVTSSDTGVFAISENKIYCYNKSGELTNTIDLQNSILDLVFSKGNIYVLDEKGISEYSLD